MTFYRINVTNDVDKLIQSIIWNIWVLVIREKRESEVTRCLPKRERERERNNRRPHNQQVLFVLLLRCCCESSPLQIGSFSLPRCCFYFSTKPVHNLTDLLSKFDNIEMRKRLIIFIYWSNKSHRIASPGWCRIASRCP